MDSRNSEMPTALTEATRNLYQVPTDSLGKWYCFWSTSSLTLKEEERGGRVGYDENVETEDHGQKVLILVHKQTSRQADKQRKVFFMLVARAAKSHAAIMPWSHVMSCHEIMSQSCHGVIVMPRRLRISPVSTLTSSFHWATCPRGISSAE